MKLKKWLLPIVFSLINLGAFYASLYATYLIYGSSHPDWDAMGIVIACIAAWFLSIPSLLSFIYSLKNIRNDDIDFLFTFYNSALMTLPFVILAGLENATSIFILAHFFWCELWGFIAWTVTKRRTSQKSKTN